MKDSSKCPHCDYRVQPCDETRTEWAYRIIHLVDHALRSVIEAGVYDVGDVDVSDYCYPADTWAQAAIGAREYVLVEYGDWVNTMVAVARQIRMRAIGRPAATSEYVAVESADPKAAMLAWMDEHYPSAMTVPVAKVT